MEIKGIRIPLSVVEKDLKEISNKQDLLVVLEIIKKSYISGFKDGANQQYNIMVN
jgi:hypothetical protein